MKHSSIVRVYTLVAILTVSNGVWANSSKTCESFLKGRLPDSVIEEPTLAPGELNLITRGNPQKTALLLVHGQDSAWQTFLPVIDSLASNHYVIAVDLRGHGGSPAPGWNYSSDLLANDILQSLDQLDIQKLHVVGHSFGAKTALKLALLAPSRVVSIAIEDMEIPQKLNGSLLPYLEQARSLRDGLPQEYDNKEALLVAMETYLLARAPAEQRRAIAENLASRRARENPDGTWTLLYRPWVTGLFGSQFVAENLDEATSNLSIPTLLIRADPSQSAVSEQGLVHWKSILPNLRIHEISGAAHNVHGSRPSEFVSVLNAFLSEVEND